MHTLNTWLINEKFTKIIKFLKFLSLINKTINQCLKIITLKYLNCSLKLIILTTIINFTIIIITINTIIIAINTTIAALAKQGKPYSTLIATKII